MISAPRKASVATAASSLRSSAERSRGSSLGIEFEAADQRCDQGRQVQIDGEMLDARFAQCLGRDQDHLGIGFGAGRADQLGADLAELTLGSELRALHLQHLPPIGEAQGARRAREAGGGDARNLWGHVGAHRQHPVRNRVHETKGLSRHVGAGAGKQTLLEFHQRRLDALVAMGGEGREQPLHHRRFECRVGGQDIAQSRRQQGFIGVGLHVTLRPP